VACLPENSGPRRHKLARTRMAWVSRAIHMLARMSGVKEREEWGHFPRFTEGKGRTMVTTSFDRHPGWLSTPPHFLFVELRSCKCGDRASRD